MKYYNVLSGMKLNEEIKFTYRGKKVIGIVERIDSDGFLLRLLDDYIGKNESWYTGDLKWFQNNIVNK